MTRQHSLGKRNDTRRFSNGRKTTHGARPRAARSLRIESLESRQLLTTTPYLEFGDSFLGAVLSDIEANLGSDGSAIQEHLDSSQLN